LSRPASQAGHASVAKPIPVSTGVQSAKLIRPGEPDLPALAVSARISGTGPAGRHHRRDGAIRDLQVASGHPLLTRAAVEAVKQLALSPHAAEQRTGGGHHAKIDVNFTLSR